MGGWDKNSDKRQSLTCVNVYYLEVLVVHRHSMPGVGPP